jgi:hypothetical protein
MRTLISSLALFVFALAGCPKGDTQGEFGEAKPTKNDGTIGKPMEQPAAPPDFANAVTLEPKVEAGKLTVTLKLKPGYHAYAPGEEIGKPVSLTVDAPWTAENITIPEGTVKDLGELGKSKILEGDVPLTAMVKGGSGELKGTVEAQVCTDKACDRPKKHAFSVPAT